MRTVALLLILPILVVGFIKATHADSFPELEPGRWYEVPTSQLNAAAPSASDFPDLQGRIGVAGVMDSWSGGVYDTLRDRFIVWGGGHWAYGGNEIYAFDINSFTWQRLNEPSPVAGYDGKKAELPDGSPVSKHTYGNLAYLPPPIDALWNQGGARWWAGHGDTATWMFSFKDLKWHRKSNIKYSAFNNYSNYDPVTGLVWHHPNKFLYSYDPKTDEWTNHGRKPGLWDNRSSAIDPKRRKLVLIGKGEVVAYDLTGKDGYKQHKLKTTGAKEILKARSVGFEYDPVSDRFVAWSGGADVYTLNLDTLVWERHPPNRDNGVIPTKANKQGTYGRFQYIPSKDAFIAVNKTNENVYLYKLSLESGVSKNKPTTGATIERTGQYFETPSKAIAAARDGDVIEIMAGVYKDNVAVLTQNNLTLRGVGGRAHLLSTGRAAEGKGIWVIKGNNIVVENIEFSGAKVSDRNGAGIRLEGAGLTVRNCYFHHNQNGILGGHPNGDVSIENSEFAWNGHGDGQSHNMYIGKGRRFTLRFNKIHHAKVGHNVKTRARENYIENNLIYDGADGTSSYAIDIPNGGIAHIKRNLVQQGPKTENPVLIRYGAEGLKYDANELVIAENILIDELPSRGRFYRAAKVAVEFKDNITIRR